MGLRGISGTSDVNLHNADGTTGLQPESRSGTVNLSTEQKALLATVASASGQMTFSGTGRLKVDAELDASSITIGSVQIRDGVSGTLVTVKADGPDNAMVVVQNSQPLPTGAATSALQTTGNASLSSIDGKLTTTVNGLKVDGSAVTQPVSATSLPLPTGAATSALQTTGNTSLSSIDSKLTTTVNGLKTDGSAVTQPVSATALPLPTGASTSANQATEIASLASIDSKLPSIGQQTMAASLSVTIASDQSAVPISAVSLPLPSGASTSALQTTGNTSLASIDGKLNSLGQKVMAGSTPIVIASDQTAIPVSQSGSWSVALTTSSAVIGHVIVDSSALPSGAATSAKQPSLGTAGSASTDVITVQGIASMTPLNVDGSGVTQPVSGTVTANQGGAPWSQNLTQVGGSAVTLGQKTSANSIPVVISSDQPAINVNITGGSGSIEEHTLDSAGDTYSPGTTKGNAVSARVVSAAPSLTAGQFSDINLSTAGRLITDGSGVTQPVSGTVTANIGTTNGLALDATLAKLTISQGTSLGTNTGAMVMGSVTTAAPAYTTGQISPLSLTTAGALRTDASATTQPVSGTVTANIGTTGGLALDATLTGGTAKARILDSAGTALTSTLVNSRQALDVHQADTSFIISGLTAAGSAPTLNPVSVSGVDGGGLKRHLLTDTAGSLVIQPGNTANTTAWLVTGTGGTFPITAASLPLPSGAATSANQTTLGSQTTKINDGTNTAAVKAASTAAVAADPALVVAISPNNSVPVTLAQRTSVNADLATFGAGVIASRISQFAANFSTPIGLLNVTQATSGGATITQNASSVILTSGAAVTASASVQTNAIINYKPGREVYAMATAVWTTPTSSASSQKIGIYNANEGFWIGFSGTSWGVAVRTGGVDTFTAQTSFNGDKCTGSTGSGFTRGGVPEALNKTFGNLFRIRFGWLGFAPIVFEVNSPDGGWVIMHTIRQPNSSATPSTATAALPVRFEVTKSSADATSLLMTVTCIESGVVGQPGDHLYNSGTITAIGGTVESTCQNMASANVDITGTWTGAIVFEGNNGNGTWTQVNSVSPTNFQVTGITTNSTVICEVAGYQQFRVRASAAMTGTASVAIALSAQAPFFASAGIRQNVIQSTLNSTTANLASGATFTGVSESTLGVAFVQCAFASDSTCDVFLDFSTDGTNWDQSEANRIYSGIPFFESSLAANSYYRLRVINVGGATSTYLRATTFLCPVAQEESSYIASELQTDFYPNPINRSSGLSIDNRVDPDGNLQVRGGAMTDAGNFNERFPGSSLQSNLTGSVSFKNGLDILTSSSTPFSTVTAGRYVRLSTDSDSNLTQISRINGNSSVDLDAVYPGSTGSGTATISNWAQSSSGTGASISVSAGNCTIASGTSNGANSYIFRNIDTPNLQLQARFSLSARIANQTTLVGFCDAPTSPTTSANFSFTGTSNTAVDCVTTTSTGETTTATVAIPGGGNTSALHVYEIRLTPDKIAFYIDRTLVSTQTAAGAKPYDSYGVLFNISNSAAVASTNLVIDSVVVLNQEIFDVVVHQSDASKLSVSANAIANTSAPTFTEGQTAPLSVDLSGNLRVTSSSTDPVKATYRATSAIAFASATNSTDIFTITGSATKTVRVLRMGYGASQGAQAIENILCVKRSTANSGGTSAAATAVPADSNDAAATATVLNYTANPTLGTAVGTVMAHRVSIEKVASGIERIFDFTTAPSKPIVLRGTSQVLAINTNGTTIGTGLFTCWVEWTEET